MKYMTRLTTILPLLWLIGLNTAPAADQKQRFESPDTRVRLIELYTSEGCYSCPPADDWIRKLKTDKRLWKEVVPVSFHVDYWDYIGWKDKFASAQFTRRQHRYASVWGMRTVYTPGFFLNGKEWRGFFNRRIIPSASTDQAGKLSGEFVDGKLAIQYRPTASNRYYELNIAVLGFDLSNEIDAGENEGKTLRHDFVALGFKTVPMLKNKSGNFEIKTGLPAYRHDASRKGLAMWVTEQGSPVPVQATGGWLN